MGKKKAGSVILNWGLTFHPQRSNDLPDSTFGGSRACVEGPLSQSCCSSAERSSDCQKQVLEENKKQKSPACQVSGVDWGCVDMTMCCAGSKSRRWANCEGGRRTPVNKVLSKEVTIHPSVNRTCRQTTRQSHSLTHVGGSAWETPQKPTDNRWKYHWKIKKNPIKSQNL